MFNQFYHTRCRAEESVIGQEEFTVRAASVAAEEIKAQRLHQHLASLAGYELPIGMRFQARSQEGLAVGRAPVRLARLRMQDGTIAVVHSVYRADAGSRIMNYFSHIVLPSEGELSLSAADSISLWGQQAAWGASSGLVWQDVQGSASGCNKVLPAWTPPRDGIPRLLSAETVRRFLQGESVETPIGCPSLEITPSRLRGRENLRLRMSLLECALMGFLTKQKVLLVAEPGLAALLVFTVARLLPPEVTSSMTFSTYEPPGRFETSSADIVNTVADASSSFKARGAAGTLLVDTHRLSEAVPPPPNQGALSYASYAVAQLHQDRLAALEPVWRKIKEINGARELDAGSFLGAWDKFERLSRIEREPLSDSELVTYLSLAPLCRLVLERPDGRRQAVNLAVRGHDTAPAWWPTSSQDVKNLAIFRPYLTQIRELLIERIVQDFETQENWAGRCKRASYCFDKLLPGFTDYRVTELAVFSQIVERLERGDAGEQLARRLPWSTRSWILKSIAKHDRQPGPQQESLVKRAHLWMHVANVQELQLLCREDLPARWKAQATAFLLFSDNALLEVAALLLNDQSLLTNVLTLLTQDATNTPGRVAKIVGRLFDVVPKKTEKIALCYMLLKTGLLPRNRELKQMFQASISKLADGDPAWHTFFTDERELNTFAEAIGVGTEASARFWTACCRSLNASCLIDSGPPHPVLLGILRADERKWIDQSTAMASLSLIAHWRRLYRALYEGLPVGADWYALRWSLSALGIDSPRILGRLMQHVAGQSREHAGEIGELVDCAKVVAPKGADIVALARVLIESTETLPASVLEKMQVALLSVACKDTAEYYERILSGKAGLGLSPDVTRKLRDARKALVQQMREADLEAGNKNRVKRFLAGYGPAGGLAIGFLVSFECVALLSPSEIIIPGSFSVVLLFFVASLAVVVFQGRKNHNELGERDEMPTTTSRRPTILPPPKPRLRKNAR